MRRPGALRQSQVKCSCSVSDRRLGLSAAAAQHIGAKARRASPGCNGEWQAKVVLLEQGANERARQ
ncbi:MAG: hypothetical protein WAN93_04560 [Solirubrobacteraceae bacterium]